LLLNRVADEIEIRLGRQWKGDLNCPEPAAQQRVPEGHFSLTNHRFRQRRITITPVGREPARGLSKLARRALAVRQGNGWKATVFISGLGQHQNLLGFLLLCRLAPLFARNADNLMRKSDNTLRDPACALV